MLESQEIVNAVLSLVTTLIRTNFTTLILYSSAPPCANIFLCCLKDLPHEVREAQVKKLEELKRQQELHTRLAIERKIQLRSRKIKFFGIFSFASEFFVE